MLRMEPNLSSSRYADNLESLALADRIEVLAGSAAKQLQMKLRFTLHYIEDVGRYQC